MAAKSYILNYMWTAANFIIEGRMRPYGRRLCAVAMDQGCATGGPRATTRPAKPFSVALANTLIFPHHA